MDLEAEAAGSVAGELGPNGVGRGIQQRYKTEVGSKTLCYSALTMTM